MYKLLADPEKLTVIIFMLSGGIFFFTFVLMSIVKFRKGGVFRVDDVLGALSLVILSSSAVLAGIAFAVDVVTNSFSSQVQHLEGSIILLCIALSFLLFFLSLIITRVLSLQKDKASSKINDSNI